MSDHIVDLIGAYIDGELRGGQRIRVETHLGECQTCLEEYYALQALSETLNAVPLPDFPGVERFTADVALRLPRKPVKPMHTKALETSWWLAPVGLVVAWIFISTTSLVSNIIIIADGFGLLDSTSGWLVTGSVGANFSALFGQFGLLEGSSLSWFTISEKFTRSLISNIFWQISIAMLYLSWFAIWWARYSRQKFGIALDRGKKPTV